MTAARPTTRAGFTLVELLVVVGVIVILVGLTVAIMPLVNTASKRRETETTIDVLEAALQEWEVSSERSITWGENFLPNPSSRYDMQRDHPDVFSISEVLEVLRRSPASQSMIAALPTTAVHTYREGEPPRWVTVVGPCEPDPNADEAPDLYDGEVMDDHLVVLDAWGTPIRAIAPGYLKKDEFLHGTALPMDEDGTVRTYTEQRYGICIGQNMGFVSAGPDREFGSIDPTDGCFEASTDNLYNYELGDLP